MGRLITYTTSIAKTLEMINEDQVIRILPKMYPRDGSVITIKSLKVDGPQSDRYDVLIEETIAEIHRQLHPSKQI